MKYAELVLQKELNELQNKLNACVYEYHKPIIKILNEQIESVNNGLKILNAQDKSRSVTLHEESKEECDHKYQEVNWGDISYNKCYSCGKIEDKHSG